MAAAYRLKQAGIPYTVFEKGHTVGGTWWKNTYPGVRLDTPNYAYSFSFAQRDDWPQQFSQGPEIFALHPRSGRARRHARRHRNSTPKSRRHL